MRKRLLPHSWKNLLDHWACLPRFFFLKKFLDETRGGRLTTKTKMFAALNDKKGVAFLRRLFGAINAFLGLISILVRLMWAPKGLPVVFNHTSRVRRTSNGIRPLYLSPKINPEKFVVFEDGEAEFQHTKYARLYQASYVTRSCHMGGFLISSFFKRTSVADRDILAFIISRGCWRLIFRLLRPSCIRLFVWYGKESIVAAAKSLGIETADIQHGIIYKSHPFYNITKIKDSPDIDYLLPDKCLVYGEYWKSLLTRTGWHPTKVQVVGYFLDIELGNNKLLCQPYILYSSQPNNSQTIIRHIRSIHTQASIQGFKILIARHPSEHLELYNDVLCDGIVEIVSEWDSYDLLRNCAVHLSVSSTLLWEAMLFKKSSYVLDYGREAVDLLSDFINYGYGRTIKDGEFPLPFELPTEPPVAYFFSPNVDTTLTLGKKYNVDSQI